MRGLGCSPDDLRDQMIHFVIFIVDYSLVSIAAPRTLIPDRATLPPYDALLQLSPAVYDHPGAIGVNGATHLTRDEFIPSERPLILKTGKSLARENFLIKILVNLTDIACWPYRMRRDL
jgi:hypothetical protein